MISTKTNSTAHALESLRAHFEGELRVDNTSRTIYSTDASVYQQTPLAVAIPRTEQDIQKLIQFAGEHGTSLIPRTAGTSLAGQCVGEGIVVDVSQNFTKILEVNQAERWVRLQPGVIRNELNMHLRPHGMLFGPETSTQNRAMIGGMIGNNSCGSNSIVYGSTRDHVLEMRGFLSDGSETVFGELTPKEFAAKCELRNSLEGNIYRGIRDLLSNPDTRDEIAKQFPKPEIPRRNTGYAIDLLMDAQPLSNDKAPSEKPFNFCKLLAGSEGTLFFTTEIKIGCSPLPPKASGVLCAHFANVDEALRGTVIAVKYEPYGCELIDDFVLEGAARNIEQAANMKTFVQGDPNAILIIHFRADDEGQIRDKAKRLESELRAAKLGYHFPLLIGPEEEKVWDLRKAGLGILNTIPGDAKSMAVIEDTAVAVEDLPNYIAEFNERLQKHGLDCVHYAHAGTGEIHLRPILNLKTEDGNQQFRAIAADVAELVKKYRGSLSGEHGDGRLRGEFLKSMIGEKNYEVCRQVKRLWDPNNVFNPNKIVDTPPMNTGLRYEPDHPTPSIETIFDFSSTQGVLRAAEMCSGSGDCRKTELTGGTMCPSYMATRDEKDTTRARANMLRHILTNPKDHAKPFDSEEVKDILDLCLSCKGCKRECPSNVDMAKLKAEFMQGYYDVHGVPRRAKLIAGFANTAAKMAWTPWLYNFAVSFPPTASFIKWVAGFAQQRTLPKMHSTTLSKWMRNHTVHENAGKHGAVFLFCDEFTNYNDTLIGIAAVELLERLGFAVEIPKHVESGRAALSKGLIRQARTLAEHNVASLSSIVTDECPMIGIEPSAILSFRDEYPDLVSDKYREDARRLSPNCLMIDEFLARFLDTEVLNKEMFTMETKEIRLHGHCHQKAISRLLPTVRLLELPQNYTVKPMVDGEGFYKTGCCGMAGSFGYEKEHYNISKQIGELVLIPAVRQLSDDVVIAAPGTSCRHQIADLATRNASHPVEILRKALL